MAAINFEDYLSTSVRWAMFKADWPDGAIEFTESTPAEIGIPTSFSKKDEKICVATVTRFTGDDRPIVAYKAESDVRGNRDTDAWHALCSKAMGRAMKKAGYPDTITDLKILMKFRDAKNGVKKAEQVNANSASIVETKTLIAGQQVESKVPSIESKESPAKEQAKPLLDGWKSDDELESAHRTFKAMCASLDPDDLETLREHHDKLNGRAWPMSRGDLNNLNIVLSGIQADADARDKENMVDSEPLKQIIKLLSDEAQKEIVLAFGDPSKWQEKITEREYTAIADLAEAVSTEE